MNTTTTASQADTIYTGVIGTTCYLNDQRGTVTGLRYTDMQTTAAGMQRQLIGAFVRLDGPVDASGAYLASGPMLYVELGATDRDGNLGPCREVTGWRVIDRDEFDRINGLDTLRRELGWT